MDKKQRPGHIARQADAPQPSVRQPSRQAAAPQPSAQQHDARQFGFVFNQSRCTGCKTCEMACCDYHDLAEGTAFRKIREYAGGTWRQDRDGAWEQDVFAFHLSMSCNHCTNPVCVRFCSSDAIAKDDSGFVHIDGEKCAGCQLCMVACPYHAPRFDEGAGVVVKCDGCRDRVRDGLAPICVGACPTRALIFGLYSEISDYSFMVEKVQDMPDPYITQPNCSIEMSDAARLREGRDGALVNPDEA